ARAASGEARSASRRRGYARERETRARAPPPPRQARGRPARAPFRPAPAGRQILWRPGLKKPRTQPPQPGQAPPRLAHHLRSPPNFSSTSATRSAARPSHSSGMRPGRPRPASTSRAAETARAGSVPTSWFVPISTVTGRSVFSRSVRQGTPSAVVSSWMPPESVSTRRASAIRARKSTYPSGSTSFSPRGSNPAGSRARVRGWMGNTTGIEAATCASAQSNPESAAGSSTFAGRCRVASAYPLRESSSRSWIRLSRARGRAASRESIITFPTKCTRAGSIPSLRRFSSPSRDGVKSRSESRSVSTRLISSGMVQSRERSPASICPIGMPIFAGVTVRTPARPRNLRCYTDDAMNASAEGALIHYEVEPSYAGWTLAAYVAEKLKRPLPPERLERLLRGRSLVHGEAELLPETRIWAGLRFALRKRSPGDSGEPPQIPILHEDEALLVVDKPAGLALHPTARYDVSTLTWALAERHRNANGEKPDPAHRLDRET